jgi:CheY-like chemotaxis protein
MHETILIVDDEPDFLDILREFLSDEKYRVTCAAHAAEALECLARQPFDMLLSDINMPGMKGFELLGRARELQPGLKTALMTAYEVRDYLRMAKDHDIGNIITKTTPFNFEEMALLIRNLLSGDVFGLERYIDGEVHTSIVKNPSEMDTVISRIVEEIPGEHHPRAFMRGLGEILTNAVYYGSRNDRPDRKETWDTDTELEKGAEIEIFWATDPEKSGIAVRDRKGRLTKKEVLYWLERNTTKGDNGLALGLFDDHGKGLFITRETIDRLIINIKRLQLTEIVMLNYGKGLYKGYRPLWIHEV